MEYTSVREAAKKWSISERQVQKYCAQGRIDGVIKLGVSWGIPAGALKPEDPRRAEAADIREVDDTEYAAKAPEDRYRGLMPLLNTPFKPGSCLETIEAMETGPEKNIAFAEYHYFSGRAEEAAREAELYLTSHDMHIRLSASLIYAYANLSIGEISRARFALGQVKSMIAGGSEASAERRAAGTFINVASAVLLHLPLPEGTPSCKEFLPELPTGIRAFALYVQAHYLYLKKEYEKSLGVVEATFAMGAHKYPISAIYLHLVAVMDYMSLRQKEKAEEHMLAAWELARPDDLIEGLGEHHGLLGGMLEAVIKPQWPEDFKRIIDITYRFSAGWRKVHNPDTGHDVADNLTTTEFAAAMLAARGWTNQEIGEHMNISQHTVKRHLSVAMQKLGISRRQDLKKYMLR